VVDLGICSALPSSGGMHFRQGVRILTVQASENSHGEQRPRYLLLDFVMAKLTALLFHVPCVRQRPGVFTVSSLLLRSSVSAFGFPFCAASRSCRLNTPQLTLKVSVASATGTQLARVSWILQAESESGVRIRLRSFEGDLITRRSVTFRDWHGVY
jgi:hypothetical protein